MEIIKSTPATTPKMGKCRFCSADLEHTFVDLGMSPLCEDFLTAEDLRKMEPFYPLHVFVCSNCFLVQLEEFASPQEIYRDYKYYSSYSDSWLQHSEKYVNMAIQKFKLSPQSRVVEIASNDGYLLQYFVKQGVPVLGIEPSQEIARYAISIGVHTVSMFFGAHTAKELAEEYGMADLIIGNNVLAHVPDINDFVSGIKHLLNPGGSINMEFPLLLNLVDENQFDTIYHEHFSYLSFTTVQEIFANHGLRIYDVEKLSTHGGSIRIYACHIENTFLETTPRVNTLWEEEREAGQRQMAYYTSFQGKVERIKLEVLGFLIEAKKTGKTVVGYGAPGKGNTFLNFCGIRTDLMEYTVDRNPHKHGRYLPGTHIPVYSPDHIRVTKPDYVLILPWNLSEEILMQHNYIAEWGGVFVRAIPRLKLMKPHIRLEDELETE